MINKKSFWIFLGSSFEYYDFVLFALFAQQIGQVFFPYTDEIAQILGGFAVFSVGYIIRPFGGAVLGYIADRFSRSRVFLSSMLLMGVGTLGIAITPSYDQWGLVATILLVAFRFLQGISFASEIPCAITILSENGGRRFLTQCIGGLFSAANLGFLLASTVTFALHLILTPEDIQAWGWRLLFVFGGGLGIVGFFARRAFLEDYDYTNPTIGASSFREFKMIICEYFPYFVLGFGLLAITASGTIYLMHLPHTLYSDLYFTKDQVYPYFIAGLITFIIACIVFGRTSKFNSIYKSFSLSISLFPFVIGLLLYMLKEGVGSPNFNLFFLFAAFEVFMAIFFVSSLSYVAELFPSSIRNTGISLCYNFAFSVASLVPYAMTYTSKYVDSITTFVLFFMVVGGVSAFSLYKVVSIRRYEAIVAKI